MACGQENPVQVEEGESGLVIVTSCEEEGMIFEEQRVVLLEDFSNTGCIPCVESEAIISDILGFYEEDQLLGIQYHVYWPDPADPFYLAAREDNSTRTSFYSVDLTGVPYVVIDGIDTPPPSDKTEILQSVSQRVVEDRPFSLRVWDDLNGLSGISCAEVVLLSGISYRDVRIHFVLLEDDIQYDAQNGIDHFNNVMRNMFPEASGEPLEMVPGDTLSLKLTYPIQSDWVPENLKMVVFIQDHETKEVLQAVSSLTQ
jgi:hypothetical protein